jgi:hypothetical protein
MSLRATEERAAISYRILRLLRRPALSFLGCRTPRNDILIIWFVMSDVGQPTVAAQFGWQGRRPYGFDRLLNVMGMKNMVPIEFIKVE